MARRLFWLIAILLVFGLIVLSSASVVKAQKEYGSSAYYWQHQLLVGVLPGVAAMLILWRVPYRHWRPLAFPLLAGALALLVLLFVPSLGLTVNGATSWLALGAFSFQPAEVLKLALVIYLAAWLGRRQERLRQWQLGLLPFAVIMGFVALLLILQPDAGTLGIVLGMAAGVYFLAGTPWTHIVAIGLAAVVVVGSLAIVSPERLSRVTVLFDPAADARDEGWQLNQALIAIGSGGVWGVGLGQSTQKFGFLPEPIGDSIFAVLVEELGMAGGLATLIMFALLALTLAQIARRAPDAFGSLVALGMLLWVMGQAAVNMAAITGIGPLTGVPLPFISYGGTSMVSMLAGLGIVLNIAEHARETAPRSHTHRTAHP